MAPPIILLFLFKKGKDNVTKGPHQSTTLYVYFEEFFPHLVHGVAQNDHSNFVFDVGLNLHITSLFVLVNAIEKNQENIDKSSHIKAC